jgi:CRP/FNR family transcriptional regulator
LATLALPVPAADARRPADLAPLWDRTRTLELARGAYLFLPGDPAQSVFLVRSGFLRLGRLTDSGAELALDVAGPGEIVGQEAVLGEAQRSQLAQALSAVRAALLPAAALEAALAQAPALALALARHGAARSRRLEARAALNALADCRRRLERVLLELAARFGCDERRGRRIVARLTHEDLARLIGASRETVTPILGEWRAAGLIDYDRRSIVVRRLPAPPASGI